MGLFARFRPNGPAMNPSHATTSDAPVASQCRRRNAFTARPKTAPFASSRDRCCAFAVRGHLSRFEPLRHPSFLAHRLSTRHAPTWTLGGCAGANVRHDERAFRCATSCTARCYPFGSSSCTRTLDCFRASSDQTWLDRLLLPSSVVPLFSARRIRCMSTTSDFLDFAS